MNSLVDFWKEFDAKKEAGKEYIHHDDKIASKDHCFYAANKSDFDKNNDNRKIHVNLFPCPYMGDIENAKVYITMSNPGIGDKNNKNDRLLGEYADLEIPGMWEAMVANLRQDFSVKELKEYKFLHLNPTFKDTDGGRYINKLLKGCFQRYKELSQEKDEDIKKVFANNLCFLQMYPYHTGEMPSSYMSKLCSHKKAIEFYIEFLPKISKDKSKLIVVARGHGLINRDYLPEQDNVIYFNTQKNISEQRGLPFGRYSDVIAKHLFENKDR